MAKTNLYTHLMRKLAATDLTDEVYCDIYLGFTDASDIYVGDETPAAISKSSMQAEVLTADDFAKRFNVSREVANRLVGYQNDIHAEFLSAIERMKHQSARYLAIKEYLENRRYDKTMLDDYIYRDEPLKDLEPKVYLFKAIRNVAISLALLAVIAAFVRNPKNDVGFDPLGGWILAIIWAGLTLLVAIGIPKRYTTRKLLSSIEKGST